MKYLKDIFNFKETKKYKISIIILVVIIIVLQTSLSISNKKIQVLNTRINKSNIENIQDEKKSPILDNVDEIASGNQNEDDNFNESEKFQKVKEEFIKKYTEVAKENNKKYLADIVDGEKILVFETINLEMTDGQIKNSLKYLKSDEFGIDIISNKLGDKQYYKIYLIE